MPETNRAVMVIVPERADARDPLQEMAVTLWRHFDRYESDRPFLSWALGSAWMQLRRFLRSGVRQAALMQKAVDLIDEAQDERAAMLTQKRSPLPQFSPYSIVTNPCLSLQNLEMALSNCSKTNPNLFENP